jgi:hypothetical protein
MGIALSGLFLRIFTGSGMTDDGKAAPAATGVPCPYTH